MPNNSISRFQPASGVTTQPSLTQMIPSTKKRNSISLPMSKKPLPPPPPPNFYDPSLLRVSDVIPAQYRDIFPFQFFNKVQSECFNTIYNENQSMVVSSPTASGKTALFEIAMVKKLEQY